MAIYRTESVLCRRGCDTYGCPTCPREVPYDHPSRVDCYRRRELAQHIASRRPVFESGEHGAEDEILETFAGRVVQIFIRYNVRVMSDVWEDQLAAVVRTADGSFVETYVPAVDGFSAEVDATEDVLAAWEEERAARAEAAAEEEERQAEKRQQAAREAAIRAARAPAKGRLVRVVRGRKVPVGTEGFCFWQGDSAYGPRLGLRVEGRSEPVWVAASNCLAVHAELDGICVAGHEECDACEEMARACAAAGRAATDLAAKASRADYQARKSA